MLAASEHNEIWLAVIAGVVLLVPAWLNYRVATQARQATLQAAKDAREDARMARGAANLAAVKVKEVADAAIEAAKILAAAKVAAELIASNERLRRAGDAEASEP